MWSEGFEDLRGGGLAHAMYLSGLDVSQGSGIYYGVWERELSEEEGTLKATHIIVRDIDFLNHDGK
jgi:hypothetical protein